ncbi:MAG: hypothetical protein KG003_13060 [Bacteroidetes bacterium]|nr:hypothetical protein [Bacteroidota bacterium]
MANYQGTGLNPETNKPAFSSTLVLVLLLGCLSIQQAKAQLEFVSFFGTSHYSGDLGGGFSFSEMNTSELSFGSTRFALGAGVRAYATRRLAFRGNLFYGKISGDDKYTDNIPRRNRNLNFYSPIVGITGYMEFHFGFGSKGVDQFYLMGGADYFHFNPKTKYKGSVVELQPLGTEGQYFIQDKAPYNLNSGAMVLGMGANLFYSPRATLSLEITGHRTFTDYLDDVSTTYVDKSQLLTSNGQDAVALADRSLGLIPNSSDPGAIRGNPGVKDNFYFVSVVYSYRIGNSKRNSSVYNQPGGVRRGTKKRCFDF